MVLEPGRADCKSSAAAWARQAPSLPPHHSGPGGGQRGPKGTRRSPRDVCLFAAQKVDAGTH